MTKKQLPFEITVDSSANWLQSLSQLSSVNSAHELNKVVKQFRLIDEETDQTLKILVHLTPTILYIISDIVSSILAEPNKTPHKIEKLCIQLLKNLTLSFCEYTKKAEKSPEETNLAIYFGIQLIGYTQYITTLFHETPSALLWGEMGQLYQLAQSRSIVSLEIKHKIKDFKNLHNIETALKRNLLFSLLSPYQYSPNHVKELFFISDQHANLIGLNPDDFMDNNFFWNSNANFPPTRHNHKKQESNSFININTEKLLSFLQTSNFSSSLEKVTLERIIDQLSGFKKVMNSSIPVPASIPDIYHLIIGFSEITKYLKTIQDLNQIQQLSSQIIGNTTLDSMTLEPIEFEKGHLSHTTKLSDTSNSEKLVTNNQVVSLLNTTYKQYLIAYAKTIDCSIGNIVLLCRSGVKPELGIIRQKKIPQYSNTTNILIEKIFGTLSPALISMPETSAKQVITIKNKQSKSEALIEPNKFFKGTKITSTLEQSFTLEQMIDYSPFFMRFHTC